MKQPMLDPWKSPVSYKAQDMATLLRRAMDKFGWEYEREGGEMVYDKIMVIMPMMRVAHIYRFVVGKPLEITIDTYDTRPTHSSYIPWMVIKGMEHTDILEVKRLTDLVLTQLPRPPWIFTTTQRVNHGYLMPEFNKAKRAWKLLGYDSFKKWKADKPAKPRKEKRER
ncbi:MAG: hypothetical protein KAT70_05575 [Thermoplasmata archaeon]|nr:hypothetical protein [Thermoplasmata archaeon]